MNLSYFRSKLYCNKHLTISVIVHPRKAYTQHTKIKEHILNDYLTSKKQKWFLFQGIYS